MSWFSEERAIALIQQAIDLNVRDFDTGNFYCDGNAERRLGLALRRCTMEERAQLRVSSKTGTQMAPSRNPGRRRLIKDFSADTIRRDVETSLERLGIDTLDVLYLHGPNEHELFSSLPILQKLHQEKTIRAIGVCGAGDNLALAASLPEVQAVMGVYNLFHREHGQTFMHAKQAGKKVVAIAPLAQGLYRKALFRPTSLADLWYLARALVKNRAELTQARRADWLHKQAGYKATDLALGFVMASQSIDVAITTTTKPAHLTASIKAADTPLSADLLAKMETKLG